MLQCLMLIKGRSVLRFILGEILNLLMLGAGMFPVILRTEILLMFTILILGDTLTTGTRGVAVPPKTCYSTFVPETPNA